MNSVTIHLAAILIGASASNAASSAYFLTNNEATTIKDAGGSALTSGVGTVQGDGAIIQLGYFSTSTNSFSGTWNAIAGIGSLNPSLDPRVGDFDTQSDIPDGFFSISVTFDDGAGTDVGLPAADTQLAIRFYDTATEGNLSSANFNTATNNLWTFNALGDPAPTDRILDITQTTGTTVWEDSGNAFKTSITAVPEPSSFALLGLGALAMTFRRKK
tara:strand:- start:363 stop:1010 length:648 start_codon:yes stop_codon:yes gene_type:complete